MALLNAACSRAPNVAAGARVSLLVAEEPMPAVKASSRRLAPLRAAGVEGFAAGALLALGRERGCERGWLRDWARVAGCVAGRLRGVGRVAGRDGATVSTARGAGSTWAGAGTSAGAGVSLRVGAAAARLSGTGCGAALVRPTSCDRLTVTRCSGGGTGSAVANCKASAAKHGEMQHHSNRQSGDFLWAKACCLHCRRAIPHRLNRRWLRYPQTCRYASLLWAQLQPGPLRRPA